MKKLIIFTICAAVLIGIYAFADANDPFDISYPISELGNCGSQEECKNYCDTPSNHIVCIEWGKKQGVFSAVEAKKMKELSEMENRPDDPIDGPGGCKSPRECDVYCRVLENLDECLQYGVQHGYTSTEEAQKIKELANRGGPGGCKSKEQCSGYCRGPEHVEECMKFVVDEGKISQEEADIIIEMTKKGDLGKPEGPKIDEQKAMEVLKIEGAGPGGCKNTNECRAYCEDFNHAEECVEFAAKHGFMPPEEAERARKMVRIGGPGGCKTPQECDAFCGKEENRDTCFSFSKDNGFISQEEAMMMEKQMSIIKKLDDKAGPGGCRSADECSVFCSDPSKINECMNFAAETGMMSKERANTMMKQAQKMEQMKEFFMGGGLSGGMAPPSGMPPQGGTMPPKGFMPPPGGQYPMPPEGQECCSCCPAGVESCIQACCPCGKEFGPMPPKDMMMPPEGVMPYQQPPTSESGGFIPPPAPPTESYPAPEPTSVSEPTSFRYSRSLLGIVIGPFLNIFR